MAVRARRGILLNHESSDEGAGYVELVAQQTPSINPNAAAVLARILRAHLDRRQGGDELGERLASEGQTREPVVHD